MAFLLKVCLFLVLFCFPSEAQQVETGFGLICDTQAQVEQFVHEFTTTPETLTKVNNGGNPCGVLAAAFVRGKKVSQVRNSQGAFDVVEIMVVGYQLEIGWVRIPPLVQYTLYKTKEIAI